MKRHIVCAAAVFSLILGSVSPMAHAQDYEDAAWEGDAQDGAEEGGEEAGFEDISMYEPDLPEVDIVDDEWEEYGEEPETEQNPDGEEVIPDGLFVTETETASPPVLTIPAPVVTYSQDGRVTLIDGSVTDQIILSFTDAGLVLQSMLGQLGGNENTRLDPWRVLTDTNGNHYYVFRQMYADTPVLGGAVKLITDQTGLMTGLTSSLVIKMPGEEPGGITAADAEQIVLQRAAQQNRKNVELLEGDTERVILPEAQSSRYVWAVYTNNPSGSVRRGADFSCLAHYVSMSGEYLYSVSAVSAGGSAWNSGYDNSYVFEYMEPVDYTGYVDLSTGEEKEISVTLMRDRRSGVYYLGNIERRIVVADCYEFLYNGGRVVAESSQDNMEWNQAGLLSLYNYCRAYDYYRAVGWSGGDGLDTPVLILDNYCDRNHQSVDSAAYAGFISGWQVFLTGQEMDLAQYLEVPAHVFTHCVTGSVLPCNACPGDSEKICESISDIQGKTCAWLTDGVLAAAWVTGEKDQILSDAAYLLYVEGGMTPEQGRAFWLAVDCAMVPGTDYAQLSQLLPWALRAAGLEQYSAVLARAIAVTGLDTKRLPEEFDAAYALLGDGLRILAALPGKNRIAPACSALLTFARDVLKNGGFLGETARQMSRLSQASRAAKKSRPKQAPEPAVQDEAAQAAAGLFEEGA